MPTSAFHKIPDSKTPAEKYAQNKKYHSDRLGDKFAHIDEEDVLALARSFTPLKEIAVFFGVDEKTFWKHYRNVVLTGYNESRFTLRKTLMTEALNGEKWALQIVAKSVLGFKDNVDYDFQIPNEDDTQLESAAVTHLLRAK